VRCTGLQLIKLWDLSEVQESRPWELGILAVHLTESGRWPAQCQPWCFELAMGRIKKYAVLGSVTVMVHSIYIQSTAE
jgi:hypothetical protein